MSHAEAIVHKVSYGENLDNILLSTYSIYSESHLHGLRSYVANLNFSHSNCRVSEDGKDIFYQPECHDFLLLPTEFELNSKNFYSEDTLRASEFGKYGHYRGVINTYIEPQKRILIQNFQKDICPVAVMSYFEIMDGMCATLAEKKEHKWSEYFQNYASEVSQETVKSFAERGSGIYSEIKKLDALAISYGATREMRERQTLKSQIKETQSKIQKEFSKTLKSYIEKNSHKTHTKAVFNTRKLLNAADRNNGKPRPIILKSDIDRYLKYMKYGKYFGDGLTLYAYVDAQLDALKAKKEGGNWQKELFIKDSGVLGMIVAANIIVLMIPAEIPILVGAALTAGSVYGVEQLVEHYSEKAYDKWLE